MEDKKSLEQRIDDLEKQMQVMMSMINHLNKSMSLNTLSKIEDVIDEAVDKKIKYMSKKSMKSND